MVQRPSGDRIGSLRSCPGVQKPAKEAPRTFDLDHGQVAGCGCVVLLQRKSAVLVQRQFRNQLSVAILFRLTHQIAQRHRAGVLNSQFKLRTVAQLNTGSVNRRLIRIDTIAFQNGGNGCPCGHGLGNVGQNGRSLYRWQPAAGKQRKRTTWYFSIAVSILYLICQQVLTEQCRKESATLGCVRNMEFMRAICQVNQQQSVTRVINAAKSCKQLSVTIFVAAEHPRG